MNQLYYNTLPSPSRQVKFSSCSLTAIKRLSTKECVLSAPTKKGTRKGSLFPLLEFVNYGVSVFHLHTIWSRPESVKGLVISHRHTRPFCPADLDVDVYRQDGKKAREHEEHRDEKFGNVELTTNRVTT